VVNVLANMFFIPLFFIVSAITWETNNFHNKKPLEFPKGGNPLSQPKFLILGVNEDHTMD
jgi:hypothetical protein